MVRTLLGLVIGVMIGVFAGPALLSPPPGTHAPPPDTWAAATAAQMQLAAPLHAEGLTTLVALAQEYHALQRQHDAMQHPRSPWGSSPKEETAEQRAVGFLLREVSSALKAQLTVWQDKVKDLPTRDPIAQQAALRLLAYAHWLRTGGEYEYAYDFYAQLHRRPNTATPEVLDAAPESVPETP